MAIEERRQALKIMGAIGVSCMFPYEADELYGQHVHEEGRPAVLPQRKTFTEAEFASISRVADLIIPETGTPGALGAGVPYYIDSVCAASEPLRSVMGNGLEWLSGTGFLKLGETDQIARLTALSKEAEAGGDGTPERFWRAMKSMTADGYYTSKIGLRDELGYKGNTVLDRFPESTVPEH
jgi:gluconate 2-dehydrogenase gamma chain